MSFPNPYWAKLGDEQRRGVILCLLELGLSLSDIARAAGVDPSTVHAWKTGRAVPQADKLERLYNAMPEAVERCLPEPPLTQLDIDTALSVIAKALRARAWRDYVIQRLSHLLPGGLRAEPAYRVEREDIELFKGRLKAEGISSGTINYYVGYLVDFLNAVGWVLTPENLQKVYSLYAETPRKMGKTIVALKRFIDTVVRAREPQLASLLYDSFTTVQHRPKNSFRVPNLEEVRRVWEEAHKISPCAAAVWGLMAETGVRFDHLLRARFDGLQLDRRRLLLGETEGPKRQPLIFLTEGAARYMQEVYLPWREEFLARLRMQSDRLFPCKEHTLYGHLKEAREGAGLPWLEPHLLRKFNAQWLLDRSVDPTDIDLLQGRSVRERVLFEHYIADFEKRLRAVFEQHAPRVFP